MTALRINQFGAELPQIDPRRLPEKNAQIAKDVRLWRGVLEPLHGLQHVQDTTTVATPKTIFQYRPDGTWFEWSNKVNAVHSPIPDDPYERAMYTGDGDPKAASASQALSSTPYPGASFRLGVPGPGNAPTGTINGSSDESAETRFYVTTFVNSWGEEGVPSPVSSQFEVKPGQTVDLSLPSIPSGNWQLDLVRVYRTNTGANNAAFQYVGQETTGTWTFTDDVPSAQLGEKLPSQDWEMPPSDLEGLVSLPGGFLAGFRNNQVLFSVPGLPHAWPVKYRQSVDYPIVGLGVLNNAVVVCTEGQPYLAQGTNPASMVLSRVRVPLGCVSAEGIASVGGAVLYPTQRGLAFVNSGTASLITEGVFDTPDWQALEPSSIKGYDWRGLYMAFYNDADGNDGGFVLDPRNPTDGVVMTSGFPIESAYDAPEDAMLYVASDNAIRMWDEGDDQTLTWRSRRVALPQLATFKVVQVFARSYPVTVTLTRDGQHQASVTVGNNRPRRIPNARRGREFDVEISSQTEVQEVVLGTSMQAISQT